MASFRDLSIAFTLATISSSAAASPCAGFIDVDAAHPFCRYVEWIKNRGVTLGCAADLYCPDQPVVRNQMAAFMNRLGSALTPQKLLTEAVPGAVDLDANSVICQTANFAVANFPRRAYLDVVLAATGPSNADFAADLVYTTNAGATWTQLTALSNRGSIIANQWSNVANLANVDLSVGQTVRFGVRMSRVSGTGDLSDSRCDLRVSIESRDGAASPY